MKTIIYEVEGYLSVYNPETEMVEQRLSPAKVTIECANQAEFDVNYAIAEKDAIGEIIVDGEFEPEPEQHENPEYPDTPESSIWDELDKAYQEGVDSV